ncbi:MAG: hypothetical protein AB7E29_08390 [Xanthobacter sp.]
MTKAKKIGEITVNGRQVSMFTPPHDQPDFMWVDIEELARAFLPRAEARRMAAMARQVGGNKRTHATATNGDKIVTIVCHAEAQGFLGFLDVKAGRVPRNSEDMGPSSDTYSWAAAKFESEHGKLNSQEAIIHAFHNQGGPFTAGASYRGDPQ